MLTTLDNAKEVRGFYFLLMGTLYRFSTLLENAVESYKQNLQNDRPTVLLMCGTEVTTHQIVVALKVFHFENALSQSPLLDSPKKRNEAKIREQVNKKISIIKRLGSAFPEYFTKYPTPQPTEEIARWLEETG